MAHDRDIGGSVTEHGGKIACPEDCASLAESSAILLGMTAMLRTIRQHFIDSTKTILRKSALMTEKEARKNAFFAVISPLFVALIVFIEFTTPSQNFIMKIITWWLIGMMVLCTIIFPVTLYGYHNRHRIDTSGEEPYDFRPSMAGALLGTALVPLARILFDYFNIH